MSTGPSKDLEVFPNPKPERDYTIHIESPEFTCLCPKTGQPDFATLSLEYIPDQLCVELKSWKLYLWSYREEGGFSRGPHQPYPGRSRECAETAVHAPYGRVQCARRHLYHCDR